MDVPKWLQESIDDVNDAVGNVAPEHKHIEERARGYSRATAGWLQTVEQPGDRDDADPRSVLWHDCALIPAKVYRALSGHHDGSANVALLSIDRSRGAWITAAETGLAPARDVEPFVSELGRLADELDQLFPRARAG